MQGVRGVQDSVCDWLQLPWNCAHGRPSVAPLVDLRLLFPSE